jgi:hypothetical protein
MSMFRPLLATLLLAATVGCRSEPSASKSSTGDSAPSATAPARPVVAHPIPSSAPPAYACKLDADCTVAVSAPADVCCDRTVTALPISTAYLEYVAGLRKTECAGVSCPSQSFPGARLADCGYQPRCVAGKCANDCNAPATPLVPHGKPSSLGGGKDADW